MSPAGPAAAAEFLQAAYPIANGRPTLSVVGEGSVGRVRRLDAGEARYAVKEFFWGTDEEQTVHEVAFRDRAAAAGVRSPASLLARDGRYVTRMPAELGGLQVRLYEWIDGAPMAPGDPGAAEAAGTILGRMHALAVPARGELDPWYEVAPAEQAWRDLLTDGSAAGESWAAPLARALPQVLGLCSFSARVPAEPLITSHLDPQPSNFLHDGTAPVLLDWDNTGNAPPTGELAALIWSWHGTDHEAAARTLAAYHRAGGTADLTGRFAYGLPVTVHLNYLYIQARLALDPATAQHHAAARARVSTALATLADLEQAAVSTWRGRH
jgi:Ser/Thr protein kinase RdoA (MazF antagonist)